MPTATWTDVLADFEFPYNDGLDIWPLDGWLQLAYLLHDGDHLTDPLLTGWTQQPGDGAIAHGVTDASTVTLYGSTTPIGGPANCLLYTGPETFNQRMHLIRIGNYQSNGCPWQVGHCQGVWIGDPLGPLTDWLFFGWYWDGANHWIRRIDCIGGVQAWSGLVVPYDTDALFRVFGDNAGGLETDVMIGHANPWNSVVPAGPGYQYLAADMVSFVHTGAAVPGVASVDFDYWSKHEIRPGDPWGEQQYFVWIWPTSTATSAYMETVVFDPGLPVAYDFSTFFVDEIVNLGGGWYTKYRSYVDGVPLSLYWGNTYSSQTGHGVVVGQQVVIEIALYTSDPKQTPMIRSVQLDYSSSSVACGGEGRGVFRVLTELGGEGRGLHNLLQAYGGAAGRGIAYVAPSFGGDGRGVSGIARSFGGAGRGYSTRYLHLGGEGRGYFRYQVEAGGEGRAKYRISRDDYAGYRMYHGVGAEPSTPSGPDEEFTGAVPFDHAVVLTAGQSNYLLLRYRNEYNLETQNLQSTVFHVAADGSLTNAAPSDPYRVTVTAVSLGRVYIEADYLYPVDGDLAGDTWEIYLTTDGSDPVYAPADLLDTQSMLQVDGCAKLRYFSLAYAHGTPVKIVVIVSRSADGAVSPSWSVQSVTASTATVSAPESGGLFYDQILRAGE